MSKRSIIVLLTLCRVAILFAVGALSQAQNSKVCNSKDSDSSKNVSTVCPDSCQTCSNSTSLCISCKPGYYLAVNQCFPCLLNCENCSNIYTCDNCLTGYIYSSKYSACVSQQCTKSYCASCSIIKSYAACGLCGDGYMLKGSMCETCIEGCSKCSNNICQSCSSGYYRYALGCFPCISNCMTCNDNSSCVKCAKQYVYNSQRRNCYFIQTSTSATPKLLAIIIPIAAALILAFIICICMWRRRKSSSGTQVVEADLLGSMNRLEVQQLQQCGSQQAREWMKQQCPVCLHSGCDTRTTCKHYFHLKCLLSWKVVRQCCPSCSTPNIGIKSICKKCSSKILGLPKDLNVILQQVLCPECNSKTGTTM